MQVQWAQLHSPVFLGGKNLTEKLDPGKYPGIKLEYDDKAEELLVTWNGVTGHIPATNVALYIPGEPTKTKVMPQSAAQPNKAIKVQVGGPQDHVFAGPGAGKAR